MLALLSTIVLVIWVLQGAHLTRITWSGGYSPAWVILMALATAALALPIVAIWL